MIINSHAQLSNLVEVKKRIQEKYEIFALKKYLIDRALSSWVVDLSFVISIANINVKFVGLSCEGGGRGIKVVAKITKIRLLKGLI